MIDHFRVIQLLGATVLAVALVLVGFAHGSPIARLRDVADRDVAALAATRRPVPGQRRVLVVATTTTRSATLRSACYHRRVTTWGFPLSTRPPTPLSAPMRHPRHWVVVNYTVLRDGAALAALDVVR